jgi:hypothetical protein
MTIGFFRGHQFAFSACANTAVAAVVAIILAAPAVCSAASKGHSAVATKTSEVSITAPTRGSRVSGSVTIDAQRAKNVGWVDFYLDGAYLASSPPYTLSWNADTAKNGHHTILAKAHSLNGKVVGSDSVAFASGKPKATNRARVKLSASPLSNTYYVDSSGGSDSNAGTSPDAPWKSIAQVQSMLGSLKPGDSVLFLKGDVWNEQLDLDHLAGAQGSPITFSTYGDGAMPVIDGGGTRSYCIDALNTSVSYVTIDGFECRHSTVSGITFQTSGGSMPGIVVENSYIHNTGAGAYSSDGPVLGTDTGNYSNQLDFEDFSQGADGVQFLNNTVKWCGGHNCLEVHFDSGAVVIRNNVVGPGCVHGCIDTKGIGSPSSPAVIEDNTAGCGASQNLCGAMPGTSNMSPAFYFENPYNSSASVTWSGNTAKDSGVGFQFMGGGCASSSGQCTNKAALYNNTAYIPSNGYSFYGDGGGQSTIDIRNNIFDGGAIQAGNFSWDAEDHNDVGGAQGLASGGFPNSGAGDLSNVDPQYVNAANADFHLKQSSPLLNAGVSGLTSDDDIGAF